MALLEIRNLAVEFATARGRFRAVDGVDLTMDEGEILCIVGESGSGKSLTLRAIANLLPRGVTVLSGTIQYRGQDLQDDGMRCDIQRRSLLDQQLQP